MLERILKLMEDNHITATALSKELGASTSVVQDWKKGKSRPTVNQVIALSNFFNVTTDYILLGKTNADESISNIFNAFNNNNHTTITVANGETKSRQLTEIEAEIIKVASNLSTRSRTKLLTIAYQLEAEDQNNEDK